MECSAWEVACVITNAGKGLTMESAYRKPSETAYEYREMSVKEYMEFAGLTTEGAVYARIKKVEIGEIDRDVLDFEQLAPGYPIKLIVRCRIRKSIVN